MDINYHALLSAALNIFLKERARGRERASWRSTGIHHPSLLVPLKRRRPPLSIISMKSAGSSARRSPPRPRLRSRRRRRHRCRRRRRSRRRRRPSRCPLRSHT